MKRRIISGISFGLFGVLIIVLFFTPLPDITVFVLSLMSVYELLKSFGVKNKALYALSLVFSAGVIAYQSYGHMLSFEIPIFPIVAAYCMLVLVIIVADFGRTTFEHAGLSLVSSFLLPSALACFLRMRNLVSEYDGVLTRGHLRYLVWFSIAGAVLADTFALFVGVKFGKKKLCPRVSPKKTVEGAIGGVVGASVVNLIALFICNAVCYKPFPIPVWIMIIVTLVIPVISMFGDLVASTIKRNYGIKDFGNLIPGHGGIMDRMDSISFVAPVVYGLMYVLMKIYA